MKSIVVFLVGVAVGVAIADNQPKMADQVRSATAKVQAEVGEQIKELIK
ncbi:hypothetical protein [Enterovibrio norvegicus]